MPQTRHALRILVRFLAFTVLLVPLLLLAMILIVPIFANLFVGVGVDIPAPMAPLVRMIFASPWIGLVMIATVLLCGFWVLRALRRA